MPMASSPDGLISAREGGGGVPQATGEGGGVLFHSVEAQGRTLRSPDPVGIATHEQSRARANSAAGCGGRSRKAAEGSRGKCTAQGGLPSAEEGGAAGTDISPPTQLHRHCTKMFLWHCPLLGQAPPPPPPCDIPSGCCSFTGPGTVTCSSLRMLRRVAAFCRLLRPVLLLVLFPRSQSPVVGVLGLC